MRRPFLLLLGAWAALAQDYSAPPAPTGDGVLEVTVINSATNEPVKKAAVSLYGPASPRNALTDAGGKVLFDMLPDGRFVLQAVHSNFPPRQSNLPRHTEVELAPGKRRIEAKLMIEPGSAITGRVVDEDGDPLQSCRVQAMRRDSMQQGRLAAAGSAESNPDGSYRVYNLPAGKYVLAVNCVGELFTPQPFSRVPQPVRQVYAPHFYPGVHELEAASRVELAPGAERSGIDFRITRTDATELVVRLVPPDLPSGTQLQLMLIPRDKLLESTNSMRGADLDPKSGAYRFERVLPGGYEVVGYGLGAGKPYGGRMSVEVDGSKPELISLPVGFANDLTGRIEFADGGKTGLQQMKVNLEPRMSFVFSGAQPAGVDESGAFTVSGVTPGTWQVRVWPLPPHSYVKSVSTGDKEVTAGLLTLTGGGAAPLRIVIGNKPASLDVALETSTISVVSLLVASAGNPSVVLSHTRGRGSNHFSIADLAPGKYLVLTYEGEGNGPLGVPEALRPLAKEIELAEGTRAAITLKPVTNEDLQKALDEAESEP